MMITDVMAASHFLADWPAAVAMLSFVSSINSPLFIVHRPSTSTSYSPHSSQYSPAFGCTVPSLITPQLIDLATSSNNGQDRLEGLKRFLVQQSTRR